MISKNFQNAVNEFKRILEEAISTGWTDGKNCGNGLKAKESLIRSSKLINLIHEAVKQDLIDFGIDPIRIYPPRNRTSPELKIAGFLKQKDQDVCVIPTTVQKKPTLINWGPLANENITDPYGEAFCEKTLVINVRSQMSSLAKNADTLFERTFAEPMNLHLVYKDMVLGDVYLIPTHEYDEKVMVNNEVKFKSHQVNLLKYISFFSAISGRSEIDENLHKYERCVLLIVDFNRPIPKIYETAEELKKDKLIPNNTNINFDKISPSNYLSDIISIFNKRFCIDIKRI